jgi:hypothetical protein
MSLIERSLKASDILPYQDFIRLGGYLVFILNTVDGVTMRGRFREMKLTEPDQGKVALLHIVADFIVVHPDGFRIGKEHKDFPLTFSNPVLIMNKPIPGSHWKLEVRSLAEVLHISDGV